MEPVYRRSALRIISVFSMVSTDVALQMAGTMPVHNAVEETEQDQL